MKSNLFSTGVVFGLPRSGRAPLATLTSSKHSPDLDLIFSTAEVISSSVVAKSVCK